MYVIRSSLTLAAAVALLAGPALAANASATTTADVITAAIAIRKQTDINLGLVAKPTSGAYTVTLAPGGARSGSGGAGGQLIGGAGTTALFNVTGMANRNFTVSTPTSITLSTGAGGAGRELTFTPSHAASGNTGPGADGYSATQIEVHGSVAIPADVELGAYNGALPVTVEYQ